MCRDPQREYKERAQLIDRRRGCQSEHKGLTQSVMCVVLVWTLGLWKAVVLVICLVVVKTNLITKGASILLMITSVTILLMLTFFQR